MGGGSAVPDHQICPTSGRRPIDRRASRTLHLLVSAMASFFPGKLSVLRLFSFDVGDHQRNVMMTKRESPSGSYSRTGPRPPWGCLRMYYRGLIHARGQCQGSESTYGMSRRYGRYRGCEGISVHAATWEVFSEIVSEMGDDLGFLLTPEAYVVDTFLAKHPIPWGFLGRRGRFSDCPPVGFCLGCSAKWVIGQ